jgi:hypothetical protein
LMHNDIDSGGNAGGASMIQLFVRISLAMPMR